MQTVEALVELVLDLAQEAEHVAQQASQNYLEKLHRPHQVVKHVSF